MRLLYKSFIFLCLSFFISCPVYSLPDKVWNYEVIVNGNNDSIAYGWTLKDISEMFEKKSYGPFVEYDDGEFFENYYLRIEDPATKEKKRYYFSIHDFVQAIEIFQTLFQPYGKTEWSTYDDHSIVTNSELENMIMNSVNEEKKAKAEKDQEEIKARTENIVKLLREEKYADVLEAWESMAQKFNNPEAYYELYKIYSGAFPGVAANKQKAYENVYKAADGGIMSAKFELAYNFLLPRELNGRHSKIASLDVEKGIKLFEDVATSTNHLSNRALIELGWVYAQGLKAQDYAGSDKVIDIEQDFSKAFNYYYIALDRGETSVASIIGDWYKEGKGIKKDEKKAFKIYETYAEKSYICFVKMAQCYRYGIGVEINYEKALELFKESVSEETIQRLRLSTYSQEPSIYELALMYEEGLGTEKNIAEAINLYEKLLTSYAYKENATARHTALVALTDKPKEDQPKEEKVKEDKVIEDKVIEEVSKPQIIPNLPKEKQPGSILLITLESNKDFVGTDFNPDSKADTHIQVALDMNKTIVKIRVDNIGGKSLKYSSNQKDKELPLIVLNKENILNPQGKDLNYPVTEQEVFDIYMLDTGVFTDKETKLRLTFYFGDNTRAYSVYEQ